jgi:hypothetical protein
VEIIWFGLRRYFCYCTFTSKNLCPKLSDRLWAPTRPVSNWYCGLFPWKQSGWGMKLTTHLHLVLRLGLSELIPPFPRVSSWYDADSIRKNSTRFEHLQNFPSFSSSLSKLCNPCQVSILNSRLQPLQEGIKNDAINYKDCIHENWPIKCS